MAARPLIKTRIVAVLAGLLAMAGCDPNRSEVAATPPPIVEVGLPVERTVTDFQIFTARTQAVQSVDIKCRVTGYLTVIHFKDGAEVEEGKTLFSIDNRPYKAALDQAKASLELSRASLVKAQADYNIGLAVQKQSSGAISEQELVKRLGTRDESAASVKQAEANVATAQLNYGWCDVTAPISGRIDRHFVDKGNLVSQNVTTLTNIVSLRPTWAYFDVDQNTMQRFLTLIAEGKIKSARNSIVPVDMALGNNKEFSSPGSIDFVSNQLDPNTGSIRVRAVFPNEKADLSAGLFGRVRVPTSGPHPALLITDRAIGTDQGQKFILIVNDKNQVEYRAVETGQLHEGLREVLAFQTIVEPDAQGKEVRKQVEVLKSTDRVIVSGLQRVRPGATVEPKLLDMQTMLGEPRPAAAGEKKPVATTK